jgi:uncharacterized OB-fold protein
MMAEHLMIDEPFTRIEPPLTERSADFWTGGAHGELRIARCATCGWYVHPPRPVCPKCHGVDVRAVAVSGRAVIVALTRNRHAWLPEMPPPYLVAEVELIEQPRLRLLTNIVDCETSSVEIGTHVSVCFARTGDAYVPLFRPSEW